MIKLRVQTRTRVAVEESEEIIDTDVLFDELDEPLFKTPELEAILTRAGMGGLQLPFTRQSDSLEEAMRRMQSLSRRALVVGYAGPEYRLYMNRIVMNARQEGVEQCSGLRRFPDARLALFASEVEGGEIDLDDLSQELFDRHSTDFGLLFEPGALDMSAYILTRTAQLSDSILLTDEICECMHSHPYHQPPPVNGTLCRHDNTLITCI
ncbi:MAG: hypothetical protein P8074_20085 [Anaerolineales bacterium]|jgi:hypothetical protein